MQTVEIYGHPVVAEEHPVTDNSIFVPSEEQKKLMGKISSHKKGMAMDILTWLGLAKIPTMASPRRDKKAWVCTLIKQF